MQSHGIEKYIDDKTEKFWDAFLSIDVQIRNGTEPVSADLKKEIKKSTVYLGLQTFLEKNDVTEIWLTDDYIDLHVIYFCFLLELLQGKDILTHISVEENRVVAVKDYLNEAIERVLNKGDLIIKWQHEDRSYVIELMRRCSNLRRILRTYEDGSGMVVQDDSRDQQILYFVVDKVLLSKIIKTTNDKVIDIINHPIEVHEDDRYFSFPVHLRYGLTWKVPNADDLLDEFQVYEDCEYAVTENDVPLASMLLEIPEVRSSWPELERS